MSFIDDSTNNVKHQLIDSGVSNKQTIREILVSREVEAID